MQAATEAAKATIKSMKEAEDVLQVPVLQPGIR